MLGATHILGLEPLLVILLPRKPSQILLTGFQAVMLHNTTHNTYRKVNAKRKIDVWGEGVNLPTFVECRENIGI